MKVEIENINANGIGIAWHENKKIFVPYSLAGEVLEIEIVEQSNKFTRGAIRTILSPSEHRISAPCKYFEKCGGCSLQHMDAANYLAFKTSLLESALKHAGISFEAPAPIIIENRKRRRTSLKAKLSGKILQLGYYQAHSHEVIAIDECLVLVDSLNFLLKDLTKIISDFNAIIISKDAIEISLTEANNGIDILLKSKHPSGRNEKKLLTSLTEKHNIARISWKVDDDYEEIWLQHTPMISFKENEVVLPRDAFLQVSKESENLMIDFILLHTKNLSNIIDLFAGSGTYSIPISNYAKIHAVEGNREMLEVLKNFSLNLSCERRDLYKNPIKANDLEHYELAIINPPRNGATPQITAISKSKLTKVILVSCDLNSFSRDAKILASSGFKLAYIVAIDQFSFTPHLEVMASFER